MPALISAAAGQLIRPGTRTGDSGTNRQVQTAPATISDERQPEEPVPAEVLDDHRAREDPDAAADTEHRRHQADAAGDPLARELVADDPEREREDAAARALDRARDDQQRERAARRRRAACPRASTTSVQTSRCSLPYMSPSRPMIAVPTDAESRYAGEHPGDAVLGRVEVVLDRRQRRHDRRAEHREREARPPRARPA